MVTVVPSICRTCLAFCPILVTVEDGRATRVTGDPGAAEYEGYTCHDIRVPIAPPDSGNVDRLAVGDTAMMEELGQVFAESVAERRGDPAYPFRLVSQRANNTMNSIGTMVPSLTKGRHHNP